RHEKHRLNVEDQKDDGIEIVLRVELNLRVANRFDAAFISRSLVRTGLWRLEKSPPEPGQPQRQQRKDQRYANENDNEQIRIRRHGVAIKFAGNVSLPSLLESWKRGRKNFAASPELRKRIAR